MKIYSSSEMPMHRVGLTKKDLLSFLEEIVGVVG
jgi:hypothetical protein